MAQYEYDATDNRTVETVNGVQTAYSYDNNDRLSQQGSTTYNYDDNGNTLSETQNGAITSYSYDSKNKLIAFEKGGITTEYRYNDNGARRSKTDNGRTTRFIVDANRDYAQVLIETDGINTVRYHNGHDLLSQNRAGSLSYYHYDGLGSTRGLSDSSGQLTDAYNYEAFGEVLNFSGGTENSYLFTGEQFDASLDQYYLRARYYDQGVGRFTQKDTYQGRMGEPVTLHKYLYANADPVNMVDPSGNFSIGSLITTARVQAVLTTQAVVRFGSRAKSSPIGRALQAAGAFGVGALLRNESKRCYRSEGRKCRISNIVVIGSNKHPDSQAHIRDAVVGRGSNGTPIPALHTYKKGANRNRSWLARSVECKGKTGGDTGLDCDEFPFATTTTGGPAGYKRGKVSLRLIDSCANQCAGRLWGRAVGRGKNGDKYLIIPYTEFSFYYSNGRFGR